MKPWTIVVAVVAVLAVGAGAFYGGMRYGENQVLKDPTRLFTQMREGGDAQGRIPGGGFPQGGQGQAAAVQPIGGQVRGGTMGTIEAIDGNVLTISTTDGNIKVQTADTTFVEKYSSVSVSDLEVGESILVSGSTNDDGSITARSIQSMRGVAATGSGDSTDSTQ